MQRVSFVLAHELAEIKNFEHVTRKMRRVHATVFSRLHECASKNAGVQWVKTSVKTPSLESFFHFFFIMISQNVYWK